MHKYFSFSKVVWSLFILQLCLNDILCFNRICYYTNWSQYRADRGYGFFPEDIDPYLCTHIIYAFAKTDNLQLVNFEENDLPVWNGPGMYSRIMKLKEINPNLRILIAIGGWNAGSYPFEQLIRNQTTMTTFAKNSIRFMRKHSFDGLDVDWEYPILNKQPFSLLMETLRLEYETESVLTSKRRLLLTAAVAAGQATIDTSYEINRLNMVVDFINLMTYDLRGSWETKIGFHTGLYARPEERDWERTLNVDWATKYWIQKGMAREKIMLGLGLYGRGFSLVNVSNNAIGAPSNGPSTPGRVVTESGMLSYFEICSALSSGSRESWDDTQLVPSIQYGRNWIGYENQRSLRIKVNYAKQQCLGGIMVWSLDLDDFKGKFCNQGQYPLMRSIVEQIGDGSCLSPNINIIVDANTIANRTTTITSTSTTRTPSSSTPRTTSRTNTSTVTASFTSRLTTLITRSSSSSSSLTSSERITTTTRSSTIKTTRPTTSSDNTIITSVSCNELTELRFDPNDCKSFFLCLNGFATSLTKISCPNSLFFNDVTSTCTSTLPVRCRAKPTQSIDNASILILPIDNAKKTTYATLTEFSGESEIAMVTDSHANTKIELPTESPINEIITRDPTDLAEFVCPIESGIVTHPHNCFYFIMCSNGVPSLFQCPGKLVFNSELRVCDYSSTLCPQYEFRQPEPFVSIENANNIIDIEMDQVNVFKCPNLNGYFRHSLNCNLFYRCSNGIAHQQKCPPYMYFNEITLSCDKNMPETCI